MGGILTNVPMPLNDPIAQPKRPEFKGGKDPKEGHVTRAWIDFLTNQSDVLSAAPSRVKSTGPITAQSSSIGATDITEGSIAGGVYRLSYYARITTVDTTSVSLTVTLDWLDDGVAVAFSGAAMTVNATSTYQSGTTLIVVDNNSPVRYSTTWVAGTGDGRYKLLVILEALQV